MATKEANIALQIEQAERKKEAIMANNLALLNKRDNIDKQIHNNREKIAKIEHYLQKLNSSSSNEEVPATE